MLENIKHIYFLGIGGIGMSALARYFNMQGVQVSGYDKTSTELTSKLEAEGIAIHYDDWGKKAIHNVDLVVYTPAIPKENMEFIAFSESIIPMHKRAEILGEISKDYFTIAIAGTHGKTTITSMVAHFLSASGRKVNAFIGGISSNYNSNLILNKDAKIMVVEADEFDRSFLHLHPNIAIISSMDADHLDIYGDNDSLKQSFFDFIKNIKIGGSLVIHESLDVPKDFSENVYRYGENKNNDFSISESRIEGGIQLFRVSDIEQEMSLQMAGRHNLLNASSALAVCKLLDVDGYLLQKAVSSYKGVKRRFEIITKKNNRVLIDDYAHHPTEIRAAISAAREMYPGKNILGIFQPHLFSRTRDFADDFAKELSKLDYLALLNIYPAREKPILGIDSQMLLNKISLIEKYLVEKQNLEYFVSNCKAEIILMMGAGDIDRLVIKIKDIVEK